MWKLLFLSNPNTSSISGRRVGEDALESPRGECATSPFQKVESSERRRCGSVHVSTTSFLEAREPRDSGSSKHKWTTRNMFKRKFSFLVFLPPSFTFTYVYAPSRGVLGVGRGGGIWAVTVQVGRTHRGGHSGETGNLRIRRFPFFFFFCVFLFYSCFHIFFEYDFTYN